MRYGSPQSLPPTTTCCGALLLYLLLCPFLCHCSGLPTGDLGWGSPVFAKAQRKKVRLIAIFIQLGVQVGRGAFEDGASCLV